MPKECGQIIAYALKQFLIGRNNLPPFLIIVEHCFEALLYIIVTHSPQTLLNLIHYTTPTALFIIAMLNTSLLLRFLKGRSFTKVLFPPILCLILYQSSRVPLTLSIVILILMAVLLVGDVLGNIKLDFEALSINA